MKIPTAIHLLIAFIFSATSILAFANDAEEAQKKGMTLTEYRSSKGKRFNGSLSMSYLQGLDELAEAHVLSSAGLSYTLSDGWITSGSLEYYVPSDLEDSDPGRFGLLDTSISLSKPNFSKTKGGSRIGFNTTLTLPTSTLSQRNDLIAQLNTSFSMVTSFVELPRFVLFTRGGLGLSHYSYKQNVSGSTVFVPVNTYVQAGVRTTLLSSFYWTNLFRVNNSLDYDGRSELSERFVSSLSYIVTQEVSASFSFIWQDKYISIDPFFDDDKTRYAVGLNYTF